jgi:hypothetical protein
MKIRPGRSGGEAPRHLARRPEERLEARHEDRRDRRATRARADPLERGAAVDGPVGSRRLDPAPGDLRRAPRPEPRRNR